MILKSVPPREINVDASLGAFWKRFSQLSFCNKIEEIYEPIFEK
jgi:hypothetical protein